MGHPETSDFEPGEYRRAPIALAQNVWLLSGFRVKPTVIAADVVCRPATTDRLPSRLTW